MRYNFIRPDSTPKESSTDSDSRSKETEISARKNAVQRIQSQPELDGTGIRSTKELDQSDRRTNSLTPHLVPVRTNHKDIVQLQEIDDVRCAFARSLSKSAQWKARGGKSGSKFCKTLGIYQWFRGYCVLLFFFAYFFCLDDRFVLKEMSKTDLTIFENFAPNYFEYINQCLLRGQPTLLAKIYGVFKVTIKKKE